MTKTARRTRLVIAAGETVLVGAPGISLPGDWWFAKVLLDCGDEVAIAHTPAGQAEPQRQFVPITHIRAVGGDYLQLRGFQETCRAAVADLRKRVADAESALTLARGAVWAKLDELALDMPSFLP